MCLYALYLAGSPLCLDAGAARGCLHLRIQPLPPSQYLTCLQCVAQLPASAPPTQFLKCNPMMPPHFGCLQCQGAHHHLDLNLESSTTCTLTDTRTQSEQSQLTREVSSDLVFEDTSLGGFPGVMLDLGGLLANGLSTASNCLLV